LRTRALALILLLAGCAKAPEEPRTANGFPRAARAVAKVVSGSWSNEPDRDKAGEAVAVMHTAGVTKGMTVADIGAGEGYYTIRLAARVGVKGRVLAEDIVPLFHDRLADRVYRDRLVDAESRISEATRAELGRRGHQINTIDDWSWVVGGGQGIARDPESGALMAGADPRRDGYALAI